MKKIFILLVAAAALGLASCEKFLTVVPADAVFLEDVQSCKQNLAAWLTYYKNGSSVGDASDAPKGWLGVIHNDKYAAYLDMWDFSKMELEGGTLSEAQMRLIARAELGGAEWSTFYKIIGRMNLVINTLQQDGVRGEADMRNYVLGEALMHRAYCFFKLLQHYAPMNDAELGIPLYLDTDTDFKDADLTRKSQRAAYDLILGDIAEVERMLEVTPTRKSYNMMYNHDHVYRILAQIYLWKASGPVAEEDDWEKAAEAAKNAIAQTGNELPWTVAKLGTEMWGDGYLSTLPPLHYNQGGANKDYDGPNYMGYPESLIWAQTQFFTNYTDFGYDMELYNTLYASNDLRRNAWFYEAPIMPGFPPGGFSGPSKKYQGFIMGTSKYYTWFRLAEQYLILAEAQAHTDPAAGLETMAQWQSVRYTGAGPAVTAGNLLEEVKLERQREFILEGDILWLDMKRFNVAETQGREFAGYTAPALKANDIRYNFMIPESETATNPGIVRNPGWEDYRVMKTE